MKQYKKNLNYLNIKKPIYSMELIFDLETSGLITFPNKRKRNYPEPESLECYDTARIVSISWIMICKTTKNIIQQHYIIIKPNNFIIPQKVIDIHGITNEFANQYGQSIESMFDLFMENLKMVDTISSYNIDFDYNIFKSELIRLNKTEIVKELDSKNQLCLMKLCQNHMKSKYYPKLSVAYEYLFKEPMNQAHHAIHDVLNSYKCYTEIFFKSNINEDRDLCNTSS